MIRKLVEADQPVLHACLRRARQINIYMLGNLAALGVDHEISEFWGDFAQEDTDTEPPRLRGVVNRYMSGWSVYGAPDTDWAGLAAVIDNYPASAERLQDNPGGITTLVPYLQRYHAARVEAEELMTLAPVDFQPVTPATSVDVRPASWADLNALVDFYANAGTMRRTRPGIERPLRDGFFWIGVAGGEICSAALTNAVGEGYAMIGGVYTPPAWRGKGISQAVCSALSRALLGARLTPALYWIAPAAGHIYRKLGFKPVGMWRSVWLAPHSG